MLPAGQKASPFGFTDSRSLQVLRRKEKRNDTVAADSGPSPAAACAPAECLVQPVTEMCHVRSSESAVNTRACPAPGPRNSTRPTSPWPPATPPFSTTPEPQPRDEHSRPSSRTRCPFSTEINGINGPVSFVSGFSCATACEVHPFRACVCSCPPPCYGVDCRTCCLHPPGPRPTHGGRFQSGPTVRNAAGTRYICLEDTCGAHVSYIGQGEAPGSRVCAWNTRTSRGVFWDVGNPPPAEYPSGGAAAGS